VTRVPAAGGGVGFPAIDMSACVADNTNPPRPAWTALEVQPGPVCVDWLVYHTNQTGDWEIFRIGDIPGKPGANADLTLGVGKGIDDIAPSLSPDRAWMAFASNRDGNWEIYIAATDGSGVKRVTYNTWAANLYPAWAPDGRHIAFESIRNGRWNLYLFDVVTGQETRLTNVLANDMNAFWSPDSSNLVFMSDRDGKWQIYKLDIATGQVTRLSDGRGNDYDPIYSPDGKLIAFRSYRGGSKNAVIYTMHADGSGVKAISNPAGDSRNQDWSYDGALLAYQTKTGNDLAVYVYQVATGKIRRVTDKSSVNYAPTWHCNSPLLVFTSEYDRRFQPVQRERAAD
jgi:Tol biopolymer transport system component